jgi:hypothetical protein
MIPISRLGNFEVMKLALTSVFLGILAACQTVSTLPPVPTDTPPFPTLTITPSVIWFPPTKTNTPTPQVSKTPTVDLIPGMGQLILEDDFVNLDSWLIGNPGNGTVALGINEITFAITVPKGYLYSYREQPALSDFYFEVTTNPILCSGADEYGVLFRYNSSVDFLRFSLSCDGRTRLDKLFGGTASSPQPWLESITVPQVAPSTSRIAVWARGPEMRFFINDNLLFHATDRQLTSGLIGLFARSAGDSAVTISFSDLVIFQVKTQ